MSKTTTFYPSVRQINTADSKAGSNSTEIKDEEHFLRISKYLDEADSYVSTSGVYVNSSKKAIENAKKLISHAEVDLNTVLECIMESEMRIRSLKGKLPSLFNKPVYQNLDAVNVEAMALQTSENDTGAKIESLESDVIPIHMLRTLLKYAEESKMNLQNYKTSFERCGDLMLVLMHPKNDENTGNQMRTSERGSVLRENNPVADNILKNLSDLQSGSGCRPECQGSDDFGISNSRKGIHPLSPMYGKQNTNLQTEISERNAAFNGSLTKVKNDKCMENTYEKDCSSFPTSAKCMDLIQGIYSNQNVTLPKVPLFLEGMNKPRFSCLQKAASSEMRQPSGEVSDLSDLSSRRISEPNNSRQSNASHLQGEVAGKIHCSDSEIEPSGKGSEMLDRTFMDRSSNAINIPSKDLIKSAVGDSFDVLLRPLIETDGVHSRNKSYTNQAVNGAVNLEMPHTAQNATVSDYRRTSWPFINFQKRLPVNISSQVVSCRPKTMSESFANEGSSRKNMVWNHDSSGIDVPEDNVSSKEKKRIKPSLNSLSSGDLNGSKSDINGEERRFTSDAYHNKNAFNQLPFVDTNDTGDSNTISHLNRNYETVLGYPRKKSFHKPQYQNFSKSTNTDHSLSFDSSLEMASLIGNTKGNTPYRGDRKVARSSVCHSCGSTSKSASNENTTTNSTSYSRVHDDMFYESSSRNSSRTSINNPPYISSSNLTPSSIPEQGIVGTYFENPYLAGFTHPYSLSLNNESGTTLNGPYSGIAQNFSETGHFDSASSHRKDSADSFGTVKEAPISSAAAEQPLLHLGLYNSAQITERFMGRATGNYDSGTDVLSRIPIPSTHSRSAMFPYGPSATWNTSTSSQNSRTSTN